jgi:hypothetical protein
MLERFCFFQMTVKMQANPCIFFTFHRLKIISVKNLPIYLCKKYLLCANGLVLCYTPWLSSLLYPVTQFSAIPRGVRTSLPLALWLRGVSPTAMLPATTPHRAGGAAGRSKDIALHPTPRPRTSPSSGVDGMSRQAGAMLAHPSPRLPASPFIGIVGRLCREGGTQQQPIPLPAEPTFSSAAPSWASIVQDGTSTCSSSTSLIEEFFRLY